MRIHCWLTLVLMGFGLTVSAQSYAQCDEDSPFLVDFSFAPIAVDVTSAPQDVLISFEITDDLSGLERIGVTFRSPSFAQRVSCNATTPLTGSSTNGTYQCLMTVPENAESGTWLVDLVTLSDEVGWDDSFDAAELVGLGLPTQLGVTSIEDTEAPSLTGLALTPAAVNTSSGSAQIACSVSATDNLAGISGMSCQLESPSTDQRSSCVAIAPSSGSPLNGTYDCVISLPQYSEAGTWLAEITLSDRVDNRSEFLSTDLSGSGFSSQVAVATNPQDLTAPTLLDFDLTPTEVNVEDSDRIVTCSARWTDDLAGVSTFGCAGAYISPSFEFLVQSCAAVAPTTGTRLDGTWSCDLVIPRYSPAGTWDFVTTLAIDLVGNSVALDGTLLSLSGFPSSFDVICGEPGAPGLELSWTTPNVLSWPPLVDAIQYNVYGGTLGSLVDGNGDGQPDAGYGPCRNGEDSSVFDTFFVDIVNPLPGEAKYLLVGYDTVTEQDQGLGTTSTLADRIPGVSCP